MEVARHGKNGLIQTRWTSKEPHPQECTAKRCAKTGADVTGPPPRASRAARSPGGSFNVGEPRAHKASADRRNWAFLACAEPPVEMVRTHAIVLMIGTRLRTTPSTSVEFMNHRISTVPFRLPGPR